MWNHITIAVTRNALSGLVWDVFLQTSEGQDMFAGRIGAQRGYIRIEPSLGFRRASRPFRCDRVSHTLFGS